MTNQNNTGRTDGGGGGGNGNGNGNGRQGGTADGSKLEDATEIIASCADDMKALWEDPVVQGVLKKHNTRIQDMPGLCVAHLVRRCAC